MRSYELVIVVRPTLKDADKKKLLETVKGWLQETKIKKEAGSYYFWQLESETGVPSDLEQKILRNESIIRHLLLRTK
jgi:ribosomal protein S6